MLFLPFTHVGTRCDSKDWLATRVLLDLSAHSADITHPEPFLIGGSAHV